MAKKNRSEDGNTAVEEVEGEVSGEEIVAEQPKEKIGDKATTTVDAPAKKTRVSTPKGNPTFKIVAGVDPAKYIGQRGCVIRALQKLAKEQGDDKFFSHEEIVANTENLVTRVNIPDSVMWHLKGMVADKIAELQVISPPTPAPAPTAEATAA